MALPVLYSYFRSSCSYRVRIVLNLKKFEYEIIPVNLLKNENKFPGFINPQGVVPALLIDGHLLTQSLAIIDYLDAKEHDPSMCPRDELQRSRVLAAALICAADTQPLHNSGVLQNLPAENRTAWALWANRRGLARLDSHLENLSGNFCIGDTISMADVCLAPQIFSAARFGVDVKREFPRLWKIQKRLMEMQEFRDAHPHSQKDCPAEFLGKLDFFFWV